ncbi:MAG: hypothetical protein R3B47_16675 [Bacteroidia bacterium]
MIKNYAYISLIMGLLFVGAGFFLAFNPPESIASLGRYAPMLLGVAFVMYGFLRLSIAMKRLNKK